MGRFTRSRNRRKRYADHQARRDEYMGSVDAHSCRPGTVREPLTAEELSRPLNSGRGPGDMVNRPLDLPIGSEWVCECGRRWVLDWNAAARLEQWREMV